MPRPQMPREPTARGTDFVKAQRANVQQAKSDAQAAKSTTVRVEKLLRQQNATPKE